VIGGGGVEPHQSSVDFEVVFASRATPGATDPADHDVQRPPRIFPPGRRQLGSGAARNAAWEIPGRRVSPRRDAARLDLVVLLDCSCKTLASSPPLFHLLSFGCAPARARRRPRDALLHPLRARATLQVRLRGAIPPGASSSDSSLRQVAARALLTVHSFFRRPARRVPATIFISGSSAP